MAQWLASGAIFVVVLAFITLEFLISWGYFLVRGEHLLAPDVYGHLLAALGLVAAGRLVQAEVCWGYPCALLAGSLLAHLLALRLRWRRDWKLSPDAFPGRRARAAPNETAAVRV